MPSATSESHKASTGGFLKPRLSNGHDSRFSSERKILREDDEASTQAPASTAAGEEQEEQETEAPEEQGTEDENPEDTVVPAGTVASNGDVLNDEGENVGHVSEGNVKDLEGSIVDQEGDVLDEEGNVIGHAEPVEGETEKPGLEGPFKVQEDGKIIDANENPVLQLEEDADAGELAGKSVKDIDEENNLVGSNGTILAKGVELTEAAESKEGLEEVEPKPEDAEDAVEGAEEEAQKPLPDVSILEGKKVNKAGNVVDDEGNPIGRLVEGDAKKLAGKACDAEGKIWNDSGKVLGRAETLPEPEENEHAPFEDFPDALVEKSGKVVYEGEAVGKVVEGEISKLVGKKVDADGDILDKNGNVLGKAERLEDEAPEEPEATDYSVLKGGKVNKAGNIVDEKGNVIGKLVEGEAKKLAGKPVDEEGKIYNDAGKVVGQAEPLPEAEGDDSGPFEDFPDSIVEKSGIVVFEGKQVGVVIEGDISKLVGKKVDADGDILDKNGNAIGKAERKDEEEPEEPEAEPIDYSEVAGCTVNKAGNVVNDKGIAVGRIVEGNPKILIGRKVDENGKIWNDSGKVIGQVEPLPESERDESKEGPFEDFEDAYVEKNGDVVHEGEVIGKVIDGEPKKLAGKHVDPDGDIIDKHGNVVGKAERWEAPEKEPEAPVDNSILGGKRVNKAGNVVDSNGDIYGRIVEGDIKLLAGKMVDKTGAIRNEGGDVVGRAELVGDGEREGLKEGPFANIPGCSVAKDGKVVDSQGSVIGRLIEGDAKKLYGKAVDDDGDVLDKNGNTLGKAERWEEPEEERDVSPMHNRKVNKEGNVVDENGDIIGKLTSGELTQCIGKKIDEDGDVVDGKGNSIGHVSLLSDIPEPEPEPEPEEPTESEEEKEARIQQEKDDKLAASMASCIEGTLEKIQPILRMITESIESEERKPKEERNEEELVKKVKPLIEEGGQILTETNGAIRGMDPDGRIANGAKHKAGTQEATPAQYRLADKLKELTGGVAETINKAKAKIADMPHAKKQLNPLWALLAEPLGQILAAVGLLLSGVLGLVGKLLSGLGLGGLVDGLLGGLGLKQILGGLGLGGIVGTITGKK